MFLIPFVAGEEKKAEVKQEEGEKTTKADGGEKAGEKGKEGEGGIAAAAAAALAAAAVKVRNYGASAPYPAN
jgi:hypothetical protein